MLVTSSIKEMVKNFKTELPRIVVSGAKGSGKTYIYKQLLQAMTWENFIEQTGASLDASYETIIIPLLTSMNSNKMKPLIDECMEYARQNLTGMKLKKDTDTINTLMTLLETSELTRMEWVNQWFDLITGMFQESYKDISELDKAVANSGKRIVFVVDGVEDVCADSHKPPGGPRNTRHPRARRRGLPARKTPGAPRPVPGRPAPTRRRTGLFPRPAG